MLAVLVTERQKRHRPQRQHNAAPALSPLDCKADRNSLTLSSFHSKDSDASVILICPLDRVLKRNSAWSLLAIPVQSP